MSYSRLAFSCLMAMSAACLFGAQAPPANPPAPPPEAAKLPGTGAAQAKLPEHKSVEGTVESIARDGSDLRLKVYDETGKETVLLIRVSDQSLKDKLKGAQNPQAGSTPCTSPICSCICPGDKVITTISVDTANDVRTLEDILPQTIAVSAWEPWTVMLVTAVVLLLITYALSRNVRALLFIGEDNRYSNSKTQLSLWFGVVIVTYISAFFMRWLHAGLLGHLGIPTNLLVLSGLSGLTFAGAKGITTQKNADAQKKQEPVKSQGNPSFPGDLIRSDNPGQFDLGDFQMIIITLIAVVSYVWMAASFLGNLTHCLSATLPDVDGTLLAMFGIGQGAYLTKKATSDIKH